MTTRSLFSFFCYSDFRACAIIGQGVLRAQYVMDLMSNFSYLFYRVLSCSIMFYRVLSCSIVFYRVLSCSIVVLDFFTCAAKNCTFESGQCDWNNAIFHDLLWTRNSGSTGSFGTGPSRDHTLNTTRGMVMLLDSSLFMTMRLRFCCFSAI